MSNKRTRFETITSNKVNQKKKKEVPSDDDKVEENLPKNKSNEETGSTHLKKICHLLLIKELIFCIELERCPICLDDCTDPKQLSRCSHTFCTACIDHYFQSVKPQCPCCFTIYGEIRGTICLFSTGVFIV